LVKDFESIRQFNPLGRVRTPVQPDGDALAFDRSGVSHPSLAALAQCCEALPEFRSVKAAWFSPDEKV
jgi:hypothetical protein